MLGVLEMALLGLLKEQDMHGYELKKRLADVFGLSTAVSFGSLYPALARLEAAGAVSATGVPKALPAPGPEQASVEHRASRRRKVYAITSLGAKMFEELLTSSRDSNEDERSFSLRLAFARYMPADRRLGLLEHRRLVLGERLTQLAGRARSRRDDRYMRVLYERQTEALSRDVSWLDNLIQEERTGATSSDIVLGDAAVAAPLGPPGAAPAFNYSHKGRQTMLAPLASASQLQRAGQAASAGEAGAPFSDKQQVKDGV